MSSKMLMFVHGAGWWSIAIGVATLIGWLGSIEFLKRIHPDLGAMNPVTACCFILCGTALLQRNFTRSHRSSHRYLVGALFSIAIVTVGCLKITGSVLSWSWNIDQIFFSSILGSNRMAPNTALNFILMGMSILLMDVEVKGKWSPSEFLALAVGFISLLAVIGYLYGVRSFYGISSFIPMAIHTATTFLILSLGVLGNRPSRGLMVLITNPSAVGAMMRMLIPAALLVPAILGLLRLKGEWMEVFSREFGTALFAVINMIIFLTLVIWSGSNLLKSELARQKSQDELERINNQLEHLIQERTSQLQQANSELRCEIEERKKAEANIKQLNQELDQKVIERTQELQQVNKELEAFSYSVSHDLRAPLRHIDGFVELIRKHYGSSFDDKCTRYLSVISSAAKKMSDLIDDLLSFSRMSRAELKRTRVAMGSLVGNVLEDLSEETKGKTIHWNIHPLPEVWADATLLRQVWINLISNAIKYSRTRPVICIEIGSKPETDTHHVLYVRDNGVGFDMAYVHMLFGVFQRLHKEEEFEGSGIGLANVQRIVSRHEGKTWAESELNHGATFYFSLIKQPKSL